MAFVALNKVFSPQYVAWLAPLAALLAVWGCEEAAVLIGLSIVLTQVEFPRHYLQLVLTDPGIRMLVAARDLVLLAALAALTARAAGWARWRPLAAASARSG